jgi:uncharacterized protein
MTDEAAIVELDTTVSVTPDLYRSRRGSEILLVEPESASWCILDAAEWSVFCRMETSAGPRRLGDIPFDDCLTRERFDELVRMLFYRNLIALDGRTYFDPDRLWSVQRYPHYFNIHVTDGCNLACRYCRVYSRKSAPMMTPETAALIARRIVEEIPSHSVTLGFHGGEPMLNLKAIQAGVEAANETKARIAGTPRDKPVRFMMQTNGTMLSVKTLAVLKKLKVHVGISIDGPPALHDEQRVFHNGRGTSHALGRGMKAAAAASLKLGYLSVVHDPAKYVDVLNYLVTGLGARSVRINFSMPEGRAKDVLTFPDERGEDFARHWLKMVDYAVEHHEKTGVWLDISDLNLFVFFLLSKQRPHMCYRSPCGFGNSILGFGYDGRIYLCDEVVGNELFCIGDIRDDADLDALLDNSPVRRTMMNARRLENLGKCSGCVWRRFHGGGCASKTFAHYGCVDKEDPMCRFYQIVFEELMWRIWKNPKLAQLSGHYGRKLDLSRGLPVG